MGYNRSRADSDRGYVLCRPRGGLNDNLVQIERCWRYADEHNRTLVLDTRERSSGILLPFDECFVPASQPGHAIFSPGEALLELFEGLSAFPVELQGRIGTYTSSFNKEQNNYVDDLTGVRLSFDFDREYTESLLINEQSGGGDLSIGVDCLTRLQLSPKVRYAVKQQLSKLPSSGYAAVHVRHTDYRTNYERFFRRINRRLGVGPLLVCTDNAEVVERARHCFRRAEVMSLTALPKLNGMPLHDYAKKLDRDDRFVFFVSAISDLLALAGASMLYLSETQGGRLSGYSRLAAALQKDNSVLDQLVFPKDDQTDCPKRFAGGPDYPKVFIYRNRSFTYLRRRIVRAVWGGSPFLLHRLRHVVTPRRRRAI